MPKHHVAMAGPEGKEGIKQLVCNTFLYIKRTTKGGWATELQP